MGEVLQQATRISNALMSRHGSLRTCQSFAQLLVLPCRQPPAGCYLHQVHAVWQQPAAATAGNKVSMQSHEQACKHACSQAESSAHLEHSHTACCEAHPPARQLPERSSEPAGRQQRSSNADYVPMRIGTRTTSRSLQHMAACCLCLTVHRGTCCSTRRPPLASTHRSSAGKHVFLHYLRAWLVRGLL